MKDNGDGIYRLPSGRLQVGRGECQRFGCPHPKWDHDARSTGGACTKCKCSAFQSLG